MTINMLPIDPEFQAGFRPCIDVMPVQEYRPMVGSDRLEQTGNQATDRATGLPVWEFAIPVKVAADRKAEQIFVRVPLASSPDALIGTTLVFGGLHAAFGAYADNRGGVSSSWKFTASSVADATKPSQRPMPPAPAPTAERATDNGKVSA